MLTKKLHNCLILIVLFLSPVLSLAATSNAKTPLIQSYVSKKGYYYPTLQKCQPQANDAAYQKMLVGHWVNQDPEDKDGVKFTYWITYAKDGKWQAVAIELDPSAAGILTSATGTWKIENGKLTETINKVSSPLLNSLEGNTTVTQLICMGPNQLKEKHVKGTTTTAYRVLPKTTLDKTQ